MGRGMQVGRREMRRATAVQAACRKGRDCRSKGQGEERTTNMALMLMTLEVSKLSGWLNDDAPWRESRGGHAVRGEVCGSAGGRRRATNTAHAACRGERDRPSAAMNVAAGRGEGSTADWRAGHGEERTRNMPFMFVALEVSKLSGWLNTDAP